MSDCQVLIIALLQNPNITWKALLRNLAFKRAFSRYGLKMALASASSYTQFFAVCTSGNGKKVQTWFFKVRNYSETSDCLFLHEKKHVKMFLPF